MFQVFNCMNELSRQTAWSVCHSNMDIEPRCVLCAGAARFFCECQQSVTFLCPGCVTAHLAQLKHLVHQVQNLPWMDHPSGHMDMNQPDLMKLLADRPAIRLFYAVNPGNFDPDEAIRAEMEKQKQQRQGKLLPTNSDVDLLSRELPLDDLFMYCHAHSQRQPKKALTSLFTFQPDSVKICFFHPRQGGIMWDRSPRMFPSGAGICALSNGQIACSGGFSESRWLTETFTLEPESTKVTNLSAMLVTRECHGCIEYRDHIYVFGGINENGLMSQCERYVPSSRTWQTLPALDKPMSKLTPVVIYNRIYMAGYGHSAVLEFNPANLKFRSLFQGMLSATEPVCAFTCGEHLFLLQGAFLVCADVSTGASTQPARRKADHRHWYNPTHLLQNDGCVYFCRWHDEVWEFGFEHCTMRQVLSLDFSQFV